MTPDEMATIYARAFPGGRAWAAREIAALTEAPGGFAVSRESGFAIGRAVANEAELITIAVAPEARRQGIGRALLKGFEDAARGRGALAAFLEVAADNGPALALYRAEGWAACGRRRGYYRRAEGAIDAILMTRPLIGG